MYKVFVICDETLRKNGINGSAVYVGVTKRKPETVLSEYNSHNTLGQKYQNIITIDAYHTKDWANVHANRFVKLFNTKKYGLNKNSKRI